MKELIKNGCINLGCKNGWHDDRYKLYYELCAMKIPGSGNSRNLGRCYNESSFDVEIDGAIVKVISEVDSSD